MDKKKNNKNKFVYKYSLLFIDWLIDSFIYLFIGLIIYSFIYLSDWSLIFFFNLHESLLLHVFSFLATRVGSIRINGSTRSTGRVEIYVIWSGIWAYLERSHKLSGIGGFIVKLSCRPGYAGSLSSLRGLRRGLLLKEGSKNRGNVKVSQMTITLYYRPAPNIKLTII